MKFKDYLSKLNKLAAKSPEVLDFEAIYARDDEGNGYQSVSFDPSIVEVDDPEMYGHGGINQDPSNVPNAVLVN